MLGVNCQRFQHLPTANLFAKKMVTMLSMSSTLLATANLFDSVRFSPRWIIDARQRDSNIKQGGDLTCRVEVGLLEFVPFNQ